MRKDTSENFWLQVKSIGEYLLLAFKVLLAVVTIKLQYFSILYAYLVFDVIYSFYEKYKSDTHENLSIENFEQMKNSSQALQEEFDKLAESQRNYEQERKIKEDSLKFLNKLIAEGLIRDKDLLSLAGGAGYFQLFVYSASLRRQAKDFGFEVPKRQYPEFLTSLGFVRLGKNTSIFLINKDRLEKEKLKDAKEMKKFLLYHFSKLRRKEWLGFLKQVKDVNVVEFTKLQSKGYKELGYLKYNFLLTETNINPTNIGYVDNEYMGLGTVSNTSDINSQILEKVVLGRFKVDRQLKVKIRKIIEKLDVSLLLEGVAQSDRDLIDLKQDIIKSDLGIDNVIDLSQKNSDDVLNELVGIGLDEKKAKKITKQLLETTKVYKNALTELNISM